MNRDDLELADADVADVFDLFDALTGMDDDVAVARVSAETGLPRRQIVNLRKSWADYVDGPYLN